jgi:hypothetical protein
LNLSSAQTASDTILVYGSDEALLETRTMVLENAGLRVLTTLKRADTEAIIESGEILLVVLCHSLASDDCEAILTFANGRTPPLRTLVLTAGESKCSEHSPTESISAFDGPRKLIETVHHLLC